MAELNRDDYRLVLPENVELRFDVAGVGSRMAAAMVDYIVLYGGILAAIIAVSMNQAFFREIFRNAPLPDFEFFEPIVSAILILAVFFAWWGYFLLFELIWNGQTPGKRAFGLRVARRDGQPVSASASLIRNLVRAVDMFVLLGLVVMFFDSLSRRLGDFAAGTVVVREPRGRGGLLVEGVPMPDVADRARSLAPVASKLTMEHYTLIREYFLRARHMPEKRSRELASSLATDVAAVLDLESMAVGDPVQFLAAAARAFESHHQYYEASATVVSS